ncbi:MAG: radical SAM family heme chaperone HemW [Flavobacteriales bacterium]
MAGIYLHIPYCKQKCTYCNFHFSTNTKNVNEMINAMLVEIENKKDYLFNNEIETIYFGGGTPSFIQTSHINSLIKKIFSLYNVKGDAEITLELNPDDVSENKLRELKSTGINRLSIGVQSFHDEDLKFMNRSHDGNMARKSISIAKKLGFKNITIDLIYGLPNLSNKKWEENLNVIKQLKINHFSAYALTVEPKTKLDFLIKNKKLDPISDEKIEEHFKILQEISEKIGFVQYEISNFCKDKVISKHNSSYWKKKKYIGIGPSAHSFNGNSRQWNVKSNSKYILKLKSQQEYYEIEKLSENEKYNEYVLTTLRTMWGINQKYLNKNYNKKINLKFTTLIKKWIESGDVIKENENFKLSKKGMLMADGIASDLFVI